MIDTTFTKYSEWAPSQFDTKGLNLKEHQNWLVTDVSTNRCADILQESNWECFIKILEDLDADQNDHIIARFGHWANGWFEIVLVRPNSPAHKEAQEICDALSDYPILNESHFSEKEFNETCRLWENSSIKERFEYCESAGINVLRARKDELPNDDTGLLKEVILGI